MIKVPDRRFTKIKHDPKKERVSLSYQVVNGTEEPDEYTVSTRQPAHPDLLARLQDLAPHVLELCELDGVEASEVEVRSVSFSWAHDVMGVTITGLRRLKRSPAPLVLNTPHKARDHYGEEGDDSQLLGDEAVMAISKLIGEANLFLDGKRGERAQGDLFDEEAEEAAEEMVHA